MDASRVNASRLGVSQLGCERRVDAMQIELTRELLERGQARFEIYCMPCHGATGHGDGMVVQRGFPQPTSYLDQRLLDVDLMRQILRGDLVRDALEARTRVGQAPHLPSGLLSLPRRALLKQLRHRLRGGGNQPSPTAPVRRLIASTTLALRVPCLRYSARSTCTAPAIV